MDRPLASHEDLHREDLVNVLKSALSEALPGARVSITPMRDDNVFFFMIDIRAVQFIGVPRLDQHRMVYRALKGLVDFDEPIVSLRTAEMAS